MKKLFSTILVLGLLLSGCGPSAMNSLFKEEIYVQEDYPSEKIREILRGQINNIYVSEILYDSKTGRIVKPKNFDKESTYNVLSVELYEEAKKFAKFSYKSLVRIETENSILIFDGYGSSASKAILNLISNCRNYKNNNNLNIKCSSSKDGVISVEGVKVRIQMLGKFLEKYEDMYLYAIKKIKEEEVLKIKKAKLEIENQEKYKAQKLEENQKRCEEIGFVPKTDNFANCILKLIELDAIRQAALLDSKSRASLEAKIQEQAADIQNKIAEEAKASRDQKAWATLLGMTTGNSILSPSTSNSTQCFKSGETSSSLSKICYYNCGGITKALNVNSTQLCPLNANL